MNTETFYPRLLRTPHPGQEEIGADAYGGGRHDKRKGRVRGKEFMFFKSSLAQKWTELLQDPNENR